MKITHVNNDQQLKIFDDDIVACIGYFDGLHLGHQALIQQTRQEAIKRNCASAIITFDPDPWTVVNNKPNVKHLTPMKEKIQIAQNLGLDHFIVVNFTKETSKLTPQAFVENFLIALNVRALLVGEDFRFGFKGAGNVAFLQNEARAYFDTTVVTLDKDNQHKIGTTMIVQELLAGDIQAANTHLGRHYGISGFVIDGQKQGRRIGYPTANLDIVEEYVIPAEGVYAGIAEIKGVRYHSMISIGQNPTFNQTEKVSVETHILDFDEDIYGELLKQTFTHRLRGQVKFDSVEALISQIKEDEQITRALLHGSEI